MNEIQFKLTGKIIGKKQSHVWNKWTGKVGKTPEYKKWYRTAVKEIKKQLAEHNLPGVINYVRFIKFDFVFGSNHRTDVDNKITSIFDLFQDLNIITDDRWHVLGTGGWTSKFEKGKWECIITLQGFNYEQDNVS